MNSNGTELEQVVHIHRTSCRRLMAERVWWPKLGPILSPEYSLLPSQWVNPVLFAILLYSLPLWSEYLFTMHQSVLRSTVCHVTLHFRDRSGACAVFFRYRNGAEITVLICDQKPYQEWFSCRRKSSPVKQEQRLISLGWNIKKEES